MEHKTPIFEKKNVLVTGGAGFLGSHLCERLLREAKVICLDDLSNGSLGNIEHLLHNPNFEFIKYDIDAPLDLEEFSELGKFKITFQGVQEIYHLACPTNPKDFEALKLRSLWSNSAGVINALNLAAKYRAKFILASSSVVYGAATPGHAEFTEADEGFVDHLSPRAAYNEGKRFAETCVQTYRDTYKIDVKIARIFPTYGPRMRFHSGLLIPDFILNAMEGKDLVLYGDGSELQSLCYVSDMIDGLIRLMASGQDLAIVNLGADRTYPMTEIAEEILALTGSQARIATSPPMVYVVQKGLPDLRLAKEHLGWLPLVQLRDGLKKTVDYMTARKAMIHNANS